MPAQLPSRLSGDWIFTGAVTFQGSASVPPNSIGDGNFSSASPLSGGKSVNRRNITKGTSGTAVSDPGTVVWTCDGSSGEVLDFAAGVIGAAIGAATVTIDLKKNGASVLVAPIAISSSTAAYTPAAATISAAGAVTGDVFSIVVVATAGGGTLPTGLFARMVVDEVP